MAHYCILCGKRKANEQFSGRGHLRHECRECQRLPREELAARRALLEMSGFFRRQSRISEKNIERLRFLATSTNSDVSRMADALLRIAAVAPFRRRRLTRIRSTEPALLSCLAEVGLFFDDLVDSTEDTSWLEGNSSDLQDLAELEDDLPF